MLTAIDHLSDVAPNGSVLWEELVKLKKAGSQGILNPLRVRDILFDAECQRITIDNIAPDNQLFAIGDLVIRDKTRDANSLVPFSYIYRPKQQDCRDFFVCLEENFVHWPDVVSMITFKTISYTTCSICNHKSTQPVPIENQYIEFQCPTLPGKMSDLVRNHFNSYEIMHNWRDEDGCNNETEGHTRTQIFAVENTDFIIIILKRIQRDIAGQIKIVRTKIELDNDVIIVDYFGHSARFSPIGVIEHQGTVVGTSVTGHYTADVFNNSTQQWYRTSDSAPPQMISKNDITKSGYVFLYKKSNIY